jgi:hypothetical protein
MNEKVKSYFERYKSHDVVYETRGKLFHDKGSALSHAAGEKVVTYTRADAKAAASKKPKTETKGE